MERRNKSGRVIPMDPALRRRRRPSGKSTIKNSVRNSVKNPVKTSTKNSIKNPEKNNQARNKPRTKKRKQTENLQEYKRGMAIRRSTTLVAALFFIFVLVYLVRTIFTFFTTPEIPVQMVRMGSVDVPQVMEGIIIRDETVYTSPKDGVINFYVNYYDRVRPGWEVASIQNIQNVTGIRQSIAQVEEQIIRLQDLRGDLSAADPAIQRINGQIQNMVDSRLNRHIHLNMSEVYSLRDSIVQNVNIRNQMIVVENLDIGLQAELGINHQGLLERLDTNRVPVSIDGGGIVAPVTDGLEPDLTFQSMYYLTPDETRQNVDFDQIITQREVSYGDDVFKVINSNRWYIASYIPNDLIEGFSVGDNRTIHIEGRTDPLSVRVHYIRPAFAESFVIFRSTAYMIDFLDTRSIFFRTTDSVQEGLRIVSSAIREERYLAIPLTCVHEGYPRYVIRAIGEEDIRVPITVAEQDDYYALVSSSDFLALGNVLRERENPAITQVITEERAIQGVFRVNNGIAEFLPINLPEDAPVGGVYTILDPALNPRLRIYSHIVTNASLVEHGDIVFSGVR